jgi:hypothetical protein
MHGEHRCRHMSSAALRRLPVADSVTVASVMTSLTCTAPLLTVLSAVAPTLGRAPRPRVGRRRSQNLGQRWRPRNAGARDLLATG